MKSDIFNTELKRINNKNVRKSAEVILEMLPDYIFKIPASTSGRYHPRFSLGEEGLVRHVKAALLFLEEMFRDNVFGTYTDYQKDLMRMALLLHDGLKSGFTYSSHTSVEHPVIMSNFIMENKDKLLISEEDARYVSRLILTHMGPWNKDKEGNVIMPVPITDDEKLIHLCDYISSRNFIDISFENNEIVIEDRSNKVLEKSKKL